MADHSEHFIGFNCHESFRCEIQWWLWTWLLKYVMSNEKGNKYVWRSVGLLVTYKCGLP